MARCDDCGRFVVDGESGYVSTAPWEDDESAICYDCENRAITSAEEIRVLGQLKAANRTGRIDCT